MSRKNQWTVGACAIGLIGMIFTAMPSDANEPVMGRTVGSPAGQMKAQEEAGEAERKTPRTGPMKKAPRGLQVRPGAPQSPTGPTGIQNTPHHGAGQANLVVELIVPVSHPEGLPGTGMCAEAPPSGGPSTQVRFRARNAGSAPAPPSTTAVHWTGPNGFAWMSIVQHQEIQPGGAQNTYVNLPPGCYGLAAHGTCQFLVELDRNDTVVESEEDADNNRSGSCMKAGT